MRTERLPHTSLYDPPAACLGGAPLGVWVSRTRFNQPTLTHPIHPVPLKERKSVNQRRNTHIRDGTPCRAFQKPWQLHVDVLQNAEQNRGLLFGPKNQPCDRMRPAAQLEQISGVLPRGHANQTTSEKSVLRAPRSLCSVLMCVMCDGATHVQSTIPSKSHLHLRVELEFQVSRITNRS